MVDTLYICSSDLAGFSCRVASPCSIAFLRLVCAQHVVQLHPVKVQLFCIPSTVVDNATLTTLRAKVVQAQERGTETELHETTACICMGKSSAFV
eukprot:1221421-Amphidinium_carterae.1